MRATPSIPEVKPFRGLIGIAREDITPPVGIYSRSWGAALHDVADGIHRPFTLTCATFQKSTKDAPLVLAAADLGWWKSRDDERVFRDGILRALGLPASHLMVCLSHTHAGPSLSTDNASKAGGELIAPYLAHLQQCVIRAARAALNQAAPSHLSWRYDKCSLATCRDLPDPKADRYIVGYNPDAEADDTLLVGRITNEAGTTTGCIVNYACHPTTLAWQNHKLSPDYVGAMRALVEQQLGAPCLFLQGASGELSPLEQYTGDLEIPDRHGRRLGYAVLSTLEGMLPAEKRLEFSGVVESGAPLAIWSRTPQESSGTLAALQLSVELPLKDMPALAEIEAEWRECSDPVLKERLWRKRAVRSIVGDGDSANIGVWLWRLGDAILIGQPNETYSHYQIELRRALAPCPVAVMNVTNGHIGYLPPRNLFEHDIYQVWQTPFAAGGLELLLAETSQQAKSLMSQK